MKKYCQVFLSIVCICVLFLNLSCKKDNPIAPPDDTPGRRDYTWFVDTIYAGGNYINSIDGVSPNDVWVTSNPGDFSQTFYHFDGTRWSTDGMNRSFSPERLLAVASNNVWSVGFSGDIWHYDGNQWAAQIRITADSNFVVGLESIDGDSPINLYSVGTYFDSGDNMHPLIYHFNGNVWSKVNIQDAFYTLIKIRFYTPAKAVIIGSTHISDGSVPDSSKIFLFDGMHLQGIYSALENRDGTANCARIPEGIIISRGMRLTFFDGNNEHDILNIQNTLYGNVIEARSIKDIFLGMSDGIMQYDGTDVQYLFKFPDTNFRGFEIIKTFTTSVFIATHDWNTNLNIIYRGYLK